jgi:hypothetical protein
MKKNLMFVFAFLAIASLALSGCGKKTAQDQGTVEQSGQGNQGADQSAVDTVKKGLYDLMTTGAGMKCTIQDKLEGQLTMTVKGDKVRVDGFSYMIPSANGDVPPIEDKGTMVNDGVWVYMWSGQEGMKFNIKDMQSLSKQDQGQSSGDSPQNDSMDWKDWVKEMDDEGTKYDCSPTVVNDGDFAPPSDVKFEDWGEMMKGFMQMGDQMQKGAPGVPGTPPSEIPTP